MEYAEVKVVLDEKKIAKVGKYPVDYIAHNILAQEAAAYLRAEECASQSK